MKIYYAMITISCPRQTSESIILKVISWTGVRNKTWFFLHNRRIPDLQCSSWLSLWSTRVSSVCCTLPFFSSQSISHMKLWRVLHSRGWCRGVGGWIKLSGWTDDCYFTQNSKCLHRKNKKTTLPYNNMVAKFNSITFSNFQQGT